METYFERGKKQQVVTLSATTASSRRAEWTGRTTNLINECVARSFDPKAQRGARRSRGHQHREPPRAGALRRRWDAVSRIFDVEDVEDVDKFDVEDGGNRTDMIPLRCPPGTTLRPLIAAFGGDEAGSDGVRFLDRDPVIFADVLDYLRTGAADTPSASAAKGAHLWS